MEHFSSAGGLIWQVKHDYYNKLLHKLPNGSVSLSCPLIFFHDWSIALPICPQCTLPLPLWFSRGRKSVHWEKMTRWTFRRKLSESLIKQTVSPLCCYNPGYPHLAVKRQYPGTEDLRVHVYLCTLKSRATFNSQRFSSVIVS